MCTTTFNACITFEPYSPQAHRAFSRMIAKSRKKIFTRDSDIVRQVFNDARRQFHCTENEMLAQWGLHSVTSAKAYVVAELLKRGARTTNIARILNKDQSTIKHYMKKVGK